MQHCAWKLWATMHVLIPMKSEIPIRIGSSSWNWYWQSFIRSQGSKEFGQGTQTPRKNKHIHTNIADEEQIKQRNGLFQAEVKVTHSKEKNVDILANEEYPEVVVDPLLYLIFSPYNGWGSFWLGLECSLKGEGRCSLVHRVASVSGPAHLFPEASVHEL